MNSVSELRHPLLAPQRSHQCTENSTPASVQLHQWRVSVDALSGHVQLPFNFLSDTVFIRFPYWINSRHVVIKCKARVSTLLISLSRFGAGLGLAIINIYQEPPSTQEEICGFVRHSRWPHHSMTYVFMGGKTNRRPWQIPTELASLLAINHQCGDHRCVASRRLPPVNNLRCVT